MTPSFFDTFSGWVRDNYAELGKFGTDIGVSESMVSPHTIALSPEIITLLTNGCAAIFQETRTTPTTIPSVFTSFDFYLTPDGPRLIEVNTNAAGALLVYLLGQYHGFGGADYFTTVRSMFETVAAQAGVTSIRRIAIVDETPELQKTRFEFAMFQSLFQSWGWDCVIIDPGELTWTGTELHGPDGFAIDLVYNRFCDFYLETPRAAALKSALAAGFPVTPNPDEYGRMADKFVMIQLAKSQSPLIRQLIPPVIHVNQENPEALWARRKSLFFKPAHSFGSKAAYKGERISRKVFQSFWDTETIAQPYFPAGTVLRDGIDYKYDIRVYAFEGQVQLIGARLFQGQLMNFQTAGGGFAPIV